MKRKESVDETILWAIAFYLPPVKILIRISDQTKNPILYRSLGMNGADSNARVLRIAVGTKNPCKIDAVTKAIKQCLTDSHTKVDLHIEGFAVESGVADQPFGDVSYSYNCGFIFECYENRCRESRRILLWVVLFFRRPAHANAHTSPSTLFLIQQETIQGAKNRAMNAHRAYRKANKAFPHLSFGLEGGLEWSPLVPDQNGEKSLWCMAWMAVYGKRNSLLVDAMASEKATFWQPDKKCIYSLAKTGSFMLPSALSDLVKKGMELGKQSTILAIV